MARSVSEIKANITAVYVAEMAAIGRVVNPATWSSVNLQRLTIFVVAASIFIVERLFDFLRVEVDANIQARKPHSERWYAGKALEYQHGHALIPEGDTYDNAGLSDADIAAARVVKYAAVIEQMNEFGRVYLRIKLAGESGEDLSPLPADQLSGVKEYFKRVKDAGVPLQLDSLPPDALRLQWEIHYDPLILNAQGGRLDGTDSDPVGNACRAYLKNLPFNGTFVLAYITDAVQQVEGVVIPTITGAQAKFGDTAFQSVNVKYNPDAGYLRFYDAGDLSFSFIPQSAIQ